MIFPHVTRIVLTIDADAEKGEAVATAQYPGTGYDPLTQNTAPDAADAKKALLGCVKSAKYQLPASGKNEVVIVV